MLFFSISLTLALAVSFLLYLLAMQAVVRELNPSMANTWAQQHLMMGHMDEFSAKPTDLSSGLVSDNAEKDEFRLAMETITRRIRNRDAKTSFIGNLEKISDIYNDTEKLESHEKQTAKLRKEFADVLASFPIPHPDFDPAKNPKAIDRFDEDGTYHFFEEVRMDSGSTCWICHQKFDHGELMGIVHVAIPKSSLRQASQKYLAYMLAAVIVSIFLALLAVNVVIRWLVIKPLRNLRLVAESISRGEIKKRADLRTGDEFETLAGAFNRMLGHLDDTQNKLRTANMELESKVNELAHQTVRLFETNRIKSDFMATMSHELRTPLNSILGFSDVLGSIATLSDKQRKYVENINTSGRSLLTMINDILDMAKIEAGRTNLQPTSFSIAAIVSAQTDMAKPLVDKKNISLTLEIEPHLPPMKQEESRIQQILNNLLSNAVKFTPEGGRIIVSVRRLAAVPTPAPNVPPPIAGAAMILPPSRDMLVLKVTDTGVGISEADQLIIFDKFRQGASATEGNTMTREHSGSGLGLSIVREICKMLDGEIRVTSQLGVGSTFAVTLPWELESKARAGSDISADIQQFAQHRVNAMRQ
ncbi:MAG: HAMP domain-containing protein [Planctomycetaceae bacterium]|jgi:signal transduction histidine kinase|nr:HAMP domain-containing protein [Planctomycetaceae bacterium]